MNQQSGLPGIQDLYVPFTKAQWRLLEVPGSRLPYSLTLGRRECGSSRIEVNGPRSTRWSEDCRHGQHTPSRPGL
jgi:hypothetical protein